ncbi:hypothetical protein CB1_000123008 [Camelus ferus]|nr:hypothetical protein CB1_000123008 [Camelus ferus]
MLGDLTGDAVSNHRCQALRGGCRTLLAWGGAVLSLNSGELALLGDMTGDAVFNCRCQALRGGCRTLLAWLLLSRCQRWQSFLHFEATGLPFPSWTTMEEGIQLLGVWLECLRNAWVRGAGAQNPSLVGMDSPGRQRQAPIKHLACP